MGYGLHVLLQSLPTWMVRSLTICQENSQVGQSRSNVPSTEAISCTEHSMRTSSNKHFTSIYGVLNRHWHPPSLRVTCLVDGRLQKKPLLPTMHYDTVKKKKKKEETVTIGIQLSRGAVLCLAHSETLLEECVGM